MALESSLRGDAVTLNRSRVFIPELWSSEVKRFRDSKFYAAQYTKKINFEGGKGDVVHIPNISRAAVHDKLPETPVQLQGRAETEFTITVDKHKESSFLIEDIVNVQSKYSLRGEYAREAGYALARDLDNWVLAYRASINAFATQRIFTSGLIGTSPTNRSLVGLNAASILAAKERLDQADVPEEGRMILTSPNGYADLLSEPNFINFDFTSERPVMTGRVGMLYGMPVMMTSQIGNNSTTGFRNGAGAPAQPTPGVSVGGVQSPYFPTQQPLLLDNSNTTASVGLPTDVAAVNTLFGLSGPGTGSGNALIASPDTVQTSMVVHNDWLAMAVQLSPKTESDRQTEYLADLFVAHQLYGARVYRPDHAVLIHHAGV